MGERINVCMISPDFLPVWSGIGAYTVSLLEKFPQNINVHLVTVKRELSGKFLLKKSSDARILKKLEEKGIQFHFVSHAKGTFMYHLNFQLACLRAIPKICKKHDIDIIHTNFPLMSDIFVKMFKRTNIPAISTVQSTIDGQHFGVKAASLNISSLEKSDVANLLLFPPLKMCELFYVRRTPYFIAISKSVMRELMTYLGVPRERIHIIYHGVDTQRFRPNLEKENSMDISLPEDKPVVLFTGRFVATKGIDILIKSAVRVIASIPEVLFVFVGGGNFRPYMELVKPHLRKNFIFYGYSDYFLMPLLYSQATIYVAPTIYEPLGIRVLEAMSCAKPVVASNVGGISEIISHGHEGLLVPPRNHVSLAKALIELLENPSLMESLGKNARKTVIQKFSAEKMSSETVNFYRKVVDAW